MKPQWNAVRATDSTVAMRFLVSRLIFLVILVGGIVPDMDSGYCDEWFMGIGIYSL